MSDLTVNLAELAGLDTTNVDEVRISFEVLPVGIYKLEIGAAELEDKPREVKGKQLQMLLCKIPCVIKDVLELGESISPEEREKLVGKTHTETIVQTLEKPEDLATFVGRVKAFLVDVGCQGNGKLQDILGAANGHVFIAPYKVRTDKNDKDKKYGGLVLNKIAKVS